MFEWGLLLSLPTDFGSGWYLPTDLGSGCGWTYLAGELTAQLSALLLTLGSNSSGWPVTIAVVSPGGLVGWPASLHS